jgi:hypothetical protein
MRAIQTSPVSVVTWVLANSGAAAIAFASTPIAARRAAAAGPSSDENAKSARGAATKSSMIAKRPSVVATGSAWPASTTIQIASSRTNRRMSAMT